MFKMKGLTWQELRETIGNEVGFVADYVEFIMSLRPDLKNKKTITEIRTLEKKIINATGPFLSYQDSIDKQSKIVGLIIHWNHHIEKQLSDFYDATVTMARLSAKPENRLLSYNPFKKLQENTDKFLLVKDIADKIINNVDLRKPTTIEVYAMFYSIITTVQVVEFNIIEQFKESLNLFGLEEKYDAYNIFSVTTKSKNREGKYQTDLRAVRNALSHFDFKLEKKGSISNIVLNVNSIEGELKQLTFEEFRTFYFDSIFLLQSVLAIQYWMMAFATLRGYFVKKKKCPKCKIGILNVTYTEGIYKTRKDPSLFTFWICDNCNSKFPYMYKKQNK